MAGILLLGATPQPLTVLFDGQSNMNGMLTESFAPIPNALPGTSFFDDIALTWGTVPSANGLRNVLNTLVALTGQPWRGINGSVTGASIQFLMDPSPSGGLGLFAAKMALAGVSSADLVCWMQGEGNTNTAVPTQGRDYVSDLDTLHGSLATLVGRTKATLPFLIAGLTTYGGAPDTNTDETWWTIRKALFDCAQLTGVYFSHSNMDGMRNVGDVYHLDGASQTRNGARFAQTLTSVLGFGGTQAHWEITGGATIDATHTDIAVSLVGTATDFTPTSGITGWEATGNNGATWVACTGAKQSAGVIRLTHASLTTTNLRLIRYQYGMLPDVSAPVKDNSALALPLTYTRDNITPTPVSTVPRPDYWGNAYDDNQTGTTQTNAGIPIGPPAARRLVIAGLCGPGVGLTSVTITPNVGTAKSATIIAKPTNARASLAYALLDADADTATSVTVSVTYASTPFSRTQMDVWAIVSGQLSSTTPIDTKTALILANTVGSLNIATSAAGCVIAVCSNSAFSQTGVISGAETYAQRRFLSNVPCVAADSSNNSLSGASAVTATYPSSGDISIAAASWF